MQIKELELDTDPVLVTSEEDKNDIDTLTDKLNAELNTNCSKKPENENIKKSVKEMIQAFNNDQTKENTIDDMKEDNNEIHPPVDTHDQKIDSPTTTDHEEENILDSPPLDEVTGNIVDSNASMQTSNTYRIPVIITDDSLTDQPFVMSDDKKSELLAEAFDQADEHPDNDTKNAWNVDDCYLSSGDSDSENLINNLRDENSGQQNILMDLDNPSRSALDQLNEVISGAEADLQHSDDNWVDQLDDHLKDFQNPWKDHVEVETDLKDIEETKEHQLQDDFKDTDQDMGDHEAKPKDVEGPFDDHHEAGPNDDVEVPWDNNLEAEVDLNDVEVTWEDQLEANLAFVSQIEAASDETEISKHFNSEDDVTEISDIVKPIDQLDENQQSVQQEPVQIKKDDCISDETQAIGEQTSIAEKEDDLICPPYSTYEFNSAVTQFEKLEQIFKHDPNVYLDDDVDIREEPGNLPVITEVSESAEATETETNNDSESNDKKSSNRSSSEAIGNVVDDNYNDDIKKVDDTFLDSEIDPKDDSLLGDGDFADLEILKVPAAFAEDQSHGSDTDTVQIVPEEFGDTQQIQIPPGFGLDSSEAEVTSGDYLNDDPTDVTVEHDDILPPPIFPDSEAQIFETSTDPIKEPENISDDKMKENIPALKQPDQIDRFIKESGNVRQKQFRFSTTDSDDIVAKTEANSFYSLNILQQSAESIACTVTTSQTILDQDPYKDDGYQLMGADTAYLAKTQSLHKKKKKKRSDRQDDKKHPNHKTLSKSEKNLTKILRVEF